MLAGAIARGAGLQRGALGGSLQAEVNQNRQAVTVAAQQIGGIEISVGELLAMEGGQGGQQLAQQQQHLPRPKYQLPLAPALQQGPVAAATHPFAHLPKAAIGGQQRPEPRHLGMQHPLQPFQPLAQGEHPGSIQAPPGP